MDRHLPWMRCARSIMVGIFLCVQLSSCGGGRGGSEASAAVSAVVQSAADTAFQYGYPLNETMRVCDLSPNVNQLNFRSTLATPLDTAVVRPNNDTLYASACAYLGAGWVLVSMPPANGRYMSLQVFDAYSNSVAVRGPREMPASGGQYVLHLSGSGNAGLPAGVPVIEVPTPYAYVIVRTLVNGPADLAAADAAQRLIHLTPNLPNIPNRRTGIFSLSPSEEFFFKLMWRLAQNPPPDADAGLVAFFAFAGILSSLFTSDFNSTAEQRMAWESAYSRGLPNLNSATGLLGTLRGSWLMPNPKIANPGSDYALRAVVARQALFPLPTSEAIFPGTSGDGHSNYTLQLPNTWPPVDPRGFWSLTMYDANGFLVNNAINRYSISNRTPGVQFEADGSLKLYIQCGDPGGAKTSNWLPAPCGPFSMTMRLYLPTAAALEPNFTLPALQ